jgi:hypothetical protein
MTAHLDRPAKRPDYDAEYAEHVRCVVDAAPKALSAAQRDRLRVLLPGSEPARRST